MGAITMSKPALLPDWQERFHAFLDDRHMQAFAWGTNDCVMFACDAIETLCGSNPAQAYKGTYNDQDSAHEIIRVAGGLQSLCERDFAAFGLVQRADLSRMRRGDVAICIHRHMPICLVCDGAALIAPNEFGLFGVRPDTAEVKSIWGVA